MKSFLNKNRFFADLLEPFKTPLALNLTLIAIAQAAYWFSVAPAFGSSQTFYTNMHPLASSSLRIALAVLWLFCLPVLTRYLLARYFSPTAEKKKSTQSFLLQLLQIKWYLHDETKPRLNRWLVTIVCCLVAILALAFGARDNALKATYPWAGEWAGSSLFALILWAILRLIYYSAFEWFYRGYVIDTINDAINDFVETKNSPKGLTLAIWMQAIMSFMLHFGTPNAEMMGALPAGFIFAALARHGRDLQHAIIFHWVIGMSTDIYCLWYSGLLFS